MAGLNEMAALDNRSGRAYGGGIALAILTTLLTVWTTVVRDDGDGVGFFMLIMAAAVGAFAADFRPVGMARTMIGVAIMQGVLGMLIATAPVTAKIPGGSSRILLFSGAFAALWLASAACFRVASKA